MILKLLITDPLKAADEIDLLANELHQQANDIRNQHKDPFKAPSGMSDKVIIKVVPT